MGQCILIGGSKVPCAKGASLQAGPSSEQEIRPPVDDVDGGRRDYQCGVIGGSTVPCAKGASSQAGPSSEQEIRPPVDDVDGGSRDQEDG